MQSFILEISLQIDGADRINAHQHTTITNTHALSEIVFAIQTIYTFDPLTV